MILSPRSVLIGSESLLIECAAMLEEAGHHIAAVVSRQRAIRDWAETRGVAILSAPRDLPDAGLAPFDYLFSIANLSVLSPAILALPTRAAINFHDGPLPAYAGLNTPAWALLNGETRHGISWHLMDEQIDRGAILATRTFDIDADETAFSLNTKCFAAAIESFPEIIADLEHAPLASCPQIGGPRRYFGFEHRPPEAATIAWTASAEAIAGFVRALDFGSHANPLGLPKAVIGGAPILVRQMTIEPGRSGAAPGTILHANEAGIRVATATNDVTLTRVESLDGQPIAGAAMAQRGLIAGRRFDPIGSDRASDLSKLDAAVARHERWWHDRLAARAPLLLPQIDRSAISEHLRFDAIDMIFDDGDDAKTVLAATVAYLGRIADKARFDLGFSDPVFAAQFDGVAAWFGTRMPLNVDLHDDAGLDVVRDALCADIRLLHRHIGHSADLIARNPDLGGDTIPLFPVALLLVDHLDDAAAEPDTELTIAIRADGTAARWLYDPAMLDDDAVRAMQRGVETLLAAGRATPDWPWRDLPLLDPSERDRVVKGWNATTRPWRDDACISQLFAEQAARTPEAPAVTSRGVTLSYAEFDERSNRLARHLKALGVGPDSLVGINVDRSVDMLVAVIAIHKAGGAYVPLDPAYPRERLAHMIADSRASVIVTQNSLAGALPETSAAIVRVDLDWPIIAEYSAAPVDSGVAPHHLAYMIYTSGSTGLPKGVMVEHRNVVNFFAGMDEKITPSGTWLAVTSLSFDISVLELCWTICRGCHVVIATGEEMKGAKTSPAPKRPIDFSLFYFASADSGDAADQYRLLIDGAKFADANGFAAVWTPERHFHAFGGLYPNPSVTSAAIAAVTTRVQIRGGSVVVPLHHPARVAEEWSVVDNLSNGRVGIAFASGWQPNDFVLRPESFADRTAALMQGIDTVRGLWRGETRSFPGPLGKDVEVAIYPRPVQSELPFWITSAGNPETFAAAGKAGAFVLTHLLGQTAAELGVKLAAYRAARKAAGHPGEGRVTLMLHSFVGHDAEAIRAAVREPLTEYLRTSTNLVKQYAWSFPAFKQRGDPGDVDLETLSQEEMDALLDHAFDRYFETSGLFGTPRHCLALIDQLRAVGVDEIACLIDFGIPSQLVLDHLPSLDALRRLAEPTGPAEEPSLAGLMQKHGVNHLQCTPSMAQMLVEDPGARDALAALDQMMIGGEAFPPALARDLTAIVSGTVMNMYGPTETTIWSAVHSIDGAGRGVPLGRPLANQQIYILDSRQRLLPPGVPGELVIGGMGVVRGYFDRPELTAERFVADPFVADPFVAGARVYRTGDLARQRADGTLEFLGRLDHQVKIRGYRVELGEIEAVLSAHHGVARAIVAAREEAPGDIRLVGYYETTAKVPPTAAELRDHLRAQLPDFMLPAHLVALPALPRTPNGKIDRNALPAPENVVTALSTGTFVAPAKGYEEQIAAIWCEVLKLPRVGTRDNFFDIGGHSLLAVQVHRRVRAALGGTLSVTDIFRFPTISALVAYLTRADGDDAAVRQGEARAEGRRAALQRRQGARLSQTAYDGS